MVYSDRSNSVLENIKGRSPALLSASLDKQESALRKFTALPEDQLLILGPRRVPPVTSPVPNKDDAVSIMTSVGFQFLSSAEYVRIAQQVQPDIVIGMGDISFGAKPGIRKLDKMFTRTERWTKQLMQAVSAKSDTRPFPQVFAPILPVTLEQQRWYLDLLEEDLRTMLSGLAIYDVDALAGLPESLCSLPRLCLTQSSSPHQTLYEVSLGADLLTLPFVNEATDGGIAFGFVFPCRTASKDMQQLPLGHDMWLTHHATSLEPLVDGCECHTCQKHHRAYIQHLLSAKEMLAWVLLQIHNLHVVSEFFEGIRRSVDGGSFEPDRTEFGRSYAAELPEKTGAGPRLRGYQFKSEGPSETKKNEASFKSLDSGMN